MTVGWKLACRSLVASIWILIIIADVLDCVPHDAPTSEGVGVHFISWIVMGIVTGIGTFSFAWKGYVGWPQRLLTICAAVAVADVMFFYLLGICALGITAGSGRFNALRLPLVGLSSLEMIAAPTAIVALVAAFVAGHRKQVQSSP